MVTGPRGGVVDRGLRNVISVAAMSFARQLQIHRKKFIVEVRVHHKSYIPKLGWGEVCRSEHSDTHFVMELCLYCDWLQILAHEMVHIKQYLRNEICDNLDRWKTKRFKEEMDYLDQPWEKEAWRLQTKLVDHLRKEEFWL